MILGALMNYEIIHGFFVKCFEKEKSKCKVLSVEKSRAY